MQAMEDLARGWPQTGATDMESFGNVFYISGRVETNPDRMGMMIKEWDLHLSVRL